MRLLLPLFVLVLAGCQTSRLTPTQDAAWRSLDTLRTVPERTAYVHTSRYAEVTAYLDRVFAATPARPGAPRLFRTTMGTTVEGRTMPLVVWGRVNGASPEAVQAAGKLVVYIQGNIHAGEVEGKEAMQTFVRDLARGRYDRLADRLVLLVNPIYNADGNERVNLRNRGLQLGPVGGMGQRPNAQGLDLNRDMMKLASPEARALVATLNAYDAAALIDLHTTDGSFHGYRLTYSPGLHPGSPEAITAFLRGTLYPRVTERMRASGMETYYYGNLGEGPRGADSLSWSSFDPRARFVTNYAGLTGRLGILSEAYSYDSFEDRIAATYRFVVETLDVLHDRADAVRAMRRAAAPAAVPTRTRFAAPTDATILLGEVTPEPHPVTGETMLRRSGPARAVTIPEYGTFETVESVPTARAYLVPDSARAALATLRAHGFTVRPASGTVRAERFVVDSTRAAPRPFQGVRERTVWGRYAAPEAVSGAGWMEVTASNPALAPLLGVLLEPRSEDGLVTWGFFEAALVGASASPVLRAVD